MDYYQPVTRILVDRTNIQEYDAFFMEQFKTEANLVGYDLESSQCDKHDGIKKLMKIDDDGFTHGKKLIFDFKRTKITGCSFYLVKRTQIKSFHKILHMLTLKTT